MAVVYQQQLLRLQRLQLQLQDHWYIGSVTLQTLLTQVILADMSDSVYMTETHISQRVARVLTEPIRIGRI